MCPYVPHILRRFCFLRFVWLFFNYIMLHLLADFLEILIKFGRKRDKRRIVIFKFSLFWLRDVVFSRVSLHYKQLTLPVQGCFNRCFIGVHSLVHTLKSNNPDQFNHKAVAGEGNQPFPLWPQPSDRPQTPLLHTSVHLLSVCVRAWWARGVRPLCSFLFCPAAKCHWLKRRADKLTHTHMEVSLQWKLHPVPLSFQYYSEVHLLNNLGQLLLIILTKLTQCHHYTF